MIDFKIDGVSVEIASQVVFNRNRKEKADFGNVKIISTRSDRYEPFTPCQIDSLQYLIQSDNVLQLKDTLYEHELALIENIAILSTVFPVDRSFRRVPASTLEEILRIYKRELEFYQDFYFDFDDSDTIYDTEIVDKEYASKDMAAIIYDLFRSINAIPRLTFTDNLWQLSYELYTDKNDSITLNAETRQKEVNDLDYASGIIGKTRNAVGEPVYWPGKDIYTTPRTKGQMYRTSELQYELDSDITAIYQVKAKLNIFLVVDDTIGGVNNYERTIEVEITDGVYEEDVYEKLPRSAGNNPTPDDWGKTFVGEPDIESFEPYKNNTIKYALNSNIIDGLWWEQDGFTLQNSNVRALKNLITWYLMQEVWLQYGPDGTTEVLINNVTDNYDVFIDAYNDTEDIGLQVKYRPKRDIDFIAEKNSTSTLNKSYILNNQKDSMVNIGAFMRNTNAIVERIGNDKVIISQTFDDYASAYKLGDYYTDYLATDIKYILDATMCRVIAQFDKNFSNIDRETSVTREPNPYVLTGRGLQSNFIYKNYIVFYEDTTDYINDSILTSTGELIAMNLLDYNATYDKPLRHCLIKKANESYHVPLLTKGGGNIALAHMSLRDSRIVGNSFRKEGQYWYKEPVWYIREDSLDLFSITLELSNDINLKTDTSTYKYYPVVDKEPTTQITSAKLYPTFKDPNDLLAFTFEFISFSDSDDVIVGEGFSKYNNLIYEDVSDITLTVYSSTEAFNKFDRTPKGDVISADITLTSDTLTVLDTLGQPIENWCIAYGDEIILAGNNSVSEIKYIFTTNRAYRTVDTTIYNYNIRLNNLTTFTTEWSIPIRVATVSMSDTTTFSVSYDLLERIDRQVQMTNVGTFNVQYEILRVTDRTVSMVNTTSFDVQFTTLNIYDRQVAMSDTTTFNTISSYGTRAFQTIGGTTYDYTFTDTTPSSLSISEVEASLSITLDFGDIVRVTDGSLPTTYTYHEVIFEEL